MRWSTEGRGQVDIAAEGILERDGTGLADP